MAIDGNRWQKWYIDALVTVHDIVMKKERKNQRIAMVFDRSMEHLILKNFSDNDLTLLNSIIAPSLMALFDVTICYITYIIDVYDVPSYCDTTKPIFFVPLTIFTVSVCHSASCFTNIVHFSQISRFSRNDKSHPRFASLRVGNDKFAS
jgi:hypothetical protein